MGKKYIELVDINYIPKLGQLKSTVEENEKIIGAHLTLKKDNRVFSCHAVIGKFIPMDEITDEMMNGRGASVRELCLRYYPRIYEDGVEVQHGTGRGIATFKYEDFDGKIKSGYSILQPNDVVVESRESLDIFIHNVAMVCGVADIKDKGRILGKRG